MLNDDEIKLVEELGEIWNKYLKLTEQHPCDRREFCDSIHRCQHLIMIRDARRNHQEVFMEN